MFFDSMQGILRVLLVGVPAYATLIFLLRASGKRTLSKMNAFDFIITVALGSTLASIITSKSVALAEGVAALALLVLLQFAVTFATVRSRRFSRVIKSEPTLLAFQGEFLHRAMKRERVNEDEILAALRESKIASIADAHAVVLESDATLSVLPRTDATASSTYSSLKGVANFPAPPTTPSTPFTAPNSPTPAGPSNTSTAPHR